MLVYNSITGKFQCSGNTLKLETIPILFYLQVTHSITLLTLVHNNIYNVLTLIVSVLTLWKNEKVKTFPIISFLYVMGLNPTPVQGGGCFLPPYQKFAITPKNNVLEEPKLCDFSYISMTNPSIPFWGLNMARKGVSIAFLL